MVGADEAEQATTPTHLTGGAVHAAAIRATVKALRTVFGTHRTGR
jgi:hypothetical protein